MIPSLKTLCETFQIDGPTARLVREVLQGALDPCEVSQQAKALEQASYHPQKDYVLKLEAVNELVGGHGVEYVPQGTNAKSPAFYYLNMGDTYTPTLVRTGSKRYRVACWGDLVERGSYA